MVSKFRRIITRRLEQSVASVIKTKKPRIIAITGSVGKTSTKLAIAQVLSSKYKVLVHPGNYNSEIGLPLSFFELEVPARLTNPLAWIKIFRAIKRRASKFDYDVVVLEMGADQPGDIRKFMQYIKPDLGVITEIRAAHMQGFKSMENLAREKLSLAQGSQAVLMNLDSPKLREVMPRLVKIKTVTTYGVERGDYQLKVMSRAGSGGLRAKIMMGPKAYEFQTHIIAPHGLYALAAAAATGVIFELKPADIIKQLEQIQPVRGRMNPLLGRGGSLIIDDSYNAGAPYGVVEALETLRNYPGRRIAILGNMNELGDYAETGHRLVGKSCHDIDILVTIGQMAGSWLTEEAQGKAKEIYNFSSPYEAGWFVAEKLKKGDTVLVKGSQNGVFAEEATALLLANAQDRSQLVRQSREWIKRKKTQFGVQ